MGGRRVPKYEWPHRMDHQRSIEKSRAKTQNPTGEKNAVGGQHIGWPVRQHIGPAHWLARTSARWLARTGLPRKY